MAPPIDTIVLCGPDDGLRAAAIVALAARRPAGEHPVVVRSGVSASGPRAADTDAGAALPAPALPLYDAGAGCGCCIGQTALRVTLARALRRERRADRPLVLLLDLGAATRPQALEALLGSAPFGELLRPVQRIVAIDPGAGREAGCEVGREAGPGATGAQARLLEQLAWCDTLLVPEASASAPALQALGAAAPKASLLLLPLIVPGGR